MCKVFHILNRLINNFYVNEGQPIVENLPKFDEFLGHFLVLFPFFENVQNDIEKDDQTDRAEDHQPYC